MESMIPPKAPTVCEDYAVDAFRLDTVVYVDLKFVKEVQQVAWIGRSRRGRSRDAARDAK